MSEEKLFTFTDAYNRALDEAMAADSTVIMLGEDIGDKEGGGAFKVTGGLSTKYGTDRVRTTPISEQAIVGAAIGASPAGMKPVAEIMLMNFITVAMDMIVNHAAKLRFMSGGQTSVPITVRIRTGAGMGAGGQHSDMLEAWFCHTAGIKVVVPSTPADAVGGFLLSDRALIEHFLASTTRIRLITNVVDQVCCKPCRETLIRRPFVLSD